MMKEATLAFTGDANAGNRITKKAEVLLEEALPILHKIMTRDDASTQAILDTVKFLVAPIEGLLFCIFRRQTPGPKAPPQAPYR